MKTTATTEAVSSPSKEYGRWGPKMGLQHFPGRGKPLANRKKTCKSMKQQENEQNYTKKPTPVVGKKPNGKSRFMHGNGMLIQSREKTFPKSKRLALGHFRSAGG
jgi:hypothetical protein